MAKITYEYYKHKVTGQVELLATNSIHAKSKSWAKTAKPEESKSKIIKTETN